MADTGGGTMAGTPGRRPRTAAQERADGDRPVSAPAPGKAPAKKAPAKKAPVKKAQVKAPAKKAPAKKAPAQEAPAEQASTSKAARGGSPSGAATSLPTPAPHMPERSWAQPHTATTSLPEPRPGVPITKQHVAAGGATLFALLLLRRRCKRRG